MNCHKVSSLFFLDLGFSIGLTQTFPIWPKTAGTALMATWQWWPFCAPRFPVGTTQNSHAHNCLPLHYQGTYPWFGAVIGGWPAVRASHVLSVPGERLVMCRGRVIVPAFFFCKRTRLFSTFPQHLTGNFFFISCLKLSNTIMPAQWNRNFVFQS